MITHTYGPEFDVGIYRGGKRGKVVTLPKALADAFDERGYDRARLFVCDEGVLLRPYCSDSPRQPEPMRLPTWDETAIMEGGDDV